MLPNVISVKPHQDFQLDLMFQNGERRRFDMRPLLNMKPWNLISAFDQVKADYGTVVWPDGIDVAPETLYDESAPLL